MMRVIKKTEKSIWKFQLPVTDDIQLELPKDAQILSVQVQNEIPCIWALVDVNAEKETRNFKIFGTGHKVCSENLVFIGTFQMLGGGLIFHLFERK